MCESISQQLGGFAGMYKIPFITFAAQSVNIYREPISLKSVGQ